MKQIIKDFHRDRDSVISLMDFDKTILEFPIRQLESLLPHFQEHQLNKAIAKTQRSLDILRGIRSNESTKLAYKTIYNQCVVLLVSYFAATLEDIFKHCIVVALKHDMLPALRKEEISLQIGDFRRVADDPLGSAADFIVEHHGISFQDMGSVRRNCLKFLHYEPQRTEDVNDIICGQAARHIVVHSGGVINNKFLRQISDAIPRKLKPNMPQSGEIEFAPEEIVHLAASMERYLEQLSRGLAQYDK